MTGKSKAGVSYNVQIAIDCKHRLIAEQQIHTAVTDVGLLAKTAEPAHQVPEVAYIDVVADRRYVKIEDIEACEATGITPFVPKPRRESAANQHFFNKDKFCYDVGTNTYIFPSGGRLNERSRKGKIRNITFILCENCAACKICPVKARCTNSDFGQLTCYENEVILEPMAKRLNARPDITV